MPLLHCAGVSMGTAEQKSGLGFFSDANPPLAHTAHTQDMGMRKIGERKKQEHMAALNTVRKTICIRFKAQ